MLSCVKIALKYGVDCHEIFILKAFWGGEEISGVLEYPEKMEPPDYKKPGIYWIGRHGFKVTHVRQLRER